MATKTPMAGIKIDDAKPGKFNCSKNKSKNITTKIIISTILVILKELDKLSQLVKLNEKAQI